MIDQQLCVRQHGGVRARSDVLQRPDITELMRLSHDSYVQLVEGLVAIRPFEVREPDRPYQWQVGLAAAIDTMLATVDSNRELHRNWMDLVLFSTILGGNLQRYQAAQSRTGEAAGLTAAHAVRPSVVARAINVAETTVRRRLALLTVPGGPIVKTRSGLLVSQAWLSTPEAIQTSQQTHTHIRLIVANTIAQGFPIHDPASAYIVGPPPPLIYS